MTKIKYALVLSGGGFKGSFQVGAINYIKENWKAISGRDEPMHFDLVAGVSVGALNGSLVAMKKIKELNRIWRRVARDGAKVIYSSDYIDIHNQQDKVEFNIDLQSIQRKLFPDFEIQLSLFEALGLLFSKNRRESFLNALLLKVSGEIRRNITDFKALADNTELKKLLKEHLDVNHIKNCKFMSGFVSLENGNYYGVVHTDYATNNDFINGVMASTVMPTIWAPVPEINLKNEKVRFSVDGGIRNISPLGDVINEINKDDEDVDYRIIIINCSKGAVELHENPETMNIVEIGVRSLNDIALTEIFNNDIEQFYRTNDLIKQLHENNIDIKLRNYDFQKGQRTTGTLKPFKSVIIQPDSELGDSLSTNKALIEERLRLGREKAKQAFHDGQNSFIIS